MVVKSSCPNCSKQIATITYTDSKTKFTEQVGLELELFCEKCKTKSKVPSSEFRASRSSAMNITIVLLTLIVIGITVFMIKLSLSVENEYKVPYAALTLPIVGSFFLIWFMISDRKKIKAFNES